MFLLKSQDYFKFINDVKKRDICNAVVQSSPNQYKDYGDTKKYKIARAFVTSWSLHEFLIAQNLSVRVIRLLSAGV